MDALSLDQADEAGSLTDITRAEAEQYFPVLTTPFDDELIRLINEDSERHAWCSMLRGNSEHLRLELRKVDPQDRRLTFEYLCNGEVEEYSIVMADVHLVKISDGRWIFRGPDASGGNWIIGMNWCTRFMKRTLLSSLH